MDDSPGTKDLPILVAVGDRVLTRYLWPDGSGIAPKVGEIPESQLGDLSIEHALNELMEFYNIGPRQAEERLRQACYSAAVQARSFRVRDLCIISVPSDIWKLAILDTKRNEAVFLGEVFENIKILKSDLKAWMRPKSGPAKGKLARYRASDIELFPEIKTLVESEQMSVTEAARRLVKEGRVKGVGTPEAKVKRLVRAYRRGD